MEEHTEGPWQLSDVGEYSDFDGKNRVVYGGGIRIAAIHTRGEDDTENEANARLIAAAPDLFAACEEFVRKCECGEARSTRSYAQMKAAIAKVKGEQKQS